MEHLTEMVSKMISQYHTSRANVQYNLRQSLQYLLPDDATPLPYEFSDNEDLANEFNARFLVYNERLAKIDPTSPTTDECFKVNFDGTTVRMTLYQLQPLTLEKYFLSFVNDARTDRYGHIMLKREVLPENEAINATIKVRNFHSFFEETEGKLRQLHESISADQFLLDRDYFHTDFREANFHKHILEGSLTQHFLNAIPELGRRSEAGLRHEELVPFQRCKEFDELIHRQNIIFNRQMTLQVTETIFAINNLQEAMTFYFNRSKNITIEGIRSHESLEMLEKICIFSLQSITAIFQHEREIQELDNLVVPLIIGS